MRAQLRVSTNFFTVPRILKITGHKQENFDACAKTISMYFFFFFFFLKLWMVNRRLPTVHIKAKILTSDGCLGVQSSQYQETSSPFIMRRYYATLLPENIHTKKNIFVFTYSTMTRSVK